MLPFALKINIFLVHSSISSDSLIGTIFFVLRVLGIISGVNNAEESLIKETSALGLWPSVLICGHNIDLMGKKKYQEKGYAALNSPTLTLMQRKDKHYNIQPLWNSLEQFYNIQVTSWILEKEHYRVIHLILISLLCIWHRVKGYVMDVIIHLIKAFAQMHKAKSYLVHTQQIVMPLM